MATSTLSRPERRPKKEETIMIMQGIHHITAVAGDPVRNWQFYTQVLGERLVKKTVNFDDPGTYHLYYGDEGGSPGTILTFFPWPGMQQGRIGNQQVSATAYAVPFASLDYWAQRLRDHGLEVDSFDRFDKPGFAFADPDGMSLELVGVTESPESPIWLGSPVPPGHRLRGFHSATLALPQTEHTLRLLTHVFGMSIESEADGRTRLTFGGEALTGAHLDVVENRMDEHYGFGAGIVHHIAFRAKDAEEQLQWRQQVIEFGLRPTSVIDRDYFTAIYFREPGGVLFEIATDPPGFTRDEPLAELGAGLKLPRQHEHLRRQLERDLPPIPPR
jgi:glyoxalase family protein